MKKKIMLVCVHLATRLVLLAGITFISVPVFSQKQKLSKATSSPAQLKLDKRFYSAGETVNASVVLKAGTAMIHPFVIIVSPRTGDAEGVKLRSGSNGVYETENPVKLDPSSVKGRNDGVLAVQPGEVIVAYYYNTDQKNKNQQNKAAQPDIVSEFAFVRGNENYRANLMVNKSLALQQNEAVENATTLLVEGQVPVQVASNQLIFYSNNDQQWKEFMQYSNCKLVATMPGGNAKTGATYLIEVPVKEQNLNDLGQLRQFLGFKQKLVSSNEETMKLLQFCAIANLDGYAVSLNPRLQFNNADAKATLDYFSNPGTGDNMPVSFQQSLTSIQKVWNFMAIWDRDNIRVNVAIIDMGFNTNQDFRNASTMRECVADATSVRCSPGAAQGLPTVGNSLFGGRSWHGNGVVARIGAQLNDGFGTAGTGGQVVVPMLIKMSGVETYAFNIGGAIRTAVNNGANVINISAGFPCRALTSIGDFTYCDPGERGAICAALFPIVETGVIIACSALAWIPFATEICIGVATSAYIGACVAQMAIGNPGEVINDAVQFAKSRGVPVVASSGNIISPDALSTVPAELRSFINLDINRQTVEDWRVVPAGLDDVICVGASHPSNNASDMTTPLNFPPFIPFGNNETFGNRVDIWAPEDGNFMAPQFADRMPGADNPIILHGGFGGTSASAPFITGLVANVMAVNPQLNRSTSSSVSTIVRDIRNLLTTSAWRPGTSSLPTDSRRRNLVNPIEFLKAAAFAPGSPIPSFSESVYGNTWNISNTEDRDDVAATSTLMIYSREGVSRNGAIVSIPGSGTAPIIADIDRYRINILSSYAPASGEKVLIKLRTPTGSRFGNLTVRGTGLTLIRTNVIGSNEEEKVFEGPLVRAGMTVDFSVEGATADQDNIYFVGVGNATAPLIGPAHSVTLTDIITELCPTTLERGDREFNGGPLINITARLERTADESGIDVIITYRAEETGGDRTTATGVFRQRVFNAAASTRIVSISPSTASSSVVNFRGAGAGAEFGICNEGVVQDAPVTGGLIRKIAVVGDSGGNDVSAGGGCRCDTKIKGIVFNPVMVTTGPR